ncbi:Gfo/Idh/MocA family protein [Bauldia litoralis]|uniref:Gfo/Idh/MocA family protein n=1 Tax=Bauldia litoralis TaxID=665467 RepID=UPI003266AF68
MAKSATKKGPVRWGVISTANIGVAKVLPGMMKSKDIEIRAIASRTLPTARRWAKKLGIPVAYGSYEDMLNDPEIEAVYNPLPNHLHVPLTLEAAARGKHVLCEKPIAMSADEAKLLSAAGRKVHIAEAFMVRNHPQWIKARDLAQSGKLGNLRAIQALFSYYNVDPKNVRNMADIGGGAIYDIGCYPVVVSRFVFGAEPVRCMAVIDRDPKFKTDRLASAVIDFGKGRHLTFTVSTQATPYQRVHILGDKGRVEVEIPFNAPQGAALKIFLDNGKQLGDASAKAIKLPKADQYQLQGEYFSRVVRGTEKLEFGVPDAIKQARVLDAIFRSAKSGHWEKP